MRRILPLIAATFAGVLAGCVPATAEPSGGMVLASTVGAHPGGVLTSEYKGKLVPQKGDELAMFALGCFWGSEYTFRRVPGVVATAVGFSGGTTTNPSYEQVCNGDTRHAETVLVEYDPKKITYRQLLEVFWASHDPTTLNQQGPDFGDQYRSAIFAFTPGQKALAEETRNAEQKITRGKIVTQIQMAGPFYPAELYHQQYVVKTGHNSCPPPRRAIKGVKLGG